MNRRESKAPSQRQLRVGEEMRHALAMMLERGDVRDPGLQGAPVTVTEVRLSPDLRHASVFVSALGGEGTDDAVAALTRARPFLRRRIARAVALRYVPDFSFRADPSFDEVRRIEALLGDPRVARDLDSGGEDGGGGGR